MVSSNSDGIYTFVGYIAVAISGIYILRCSVFVDMSVYRGLVAFIVYLVLTCNLHFEGLQLTAIKSIPYDSFAFCSFLVLMCKLCSEGIQHHSPQSLINLTFGDFLCKIIINSGRKRHNANGFDRGPCKSHALLV